MAGTRSSSRQSGSQPSSQDQNSAQNLKRKASGSTTSSPQSKRGKAAKKEQKTIEETLPDSDMKDAADDVETEQNGKAEPGQQNGSKTDDDAAAAEDKQASKDEDSKDDKTADAQTNGHANHDSDGPSTAKAEPATDGETANKTEAGAEDDKNLKPSEDGALETSASRKAAVPSSILEKGIIYFFTRGRVGTDDPDSVMDIARSYIVLRPIPHGAKLGDGPLQDLNNNRLLALPKKVLPKTPRDRFMAFVERAGATVAELKDNFLTSNDYDTKTTGTQHSPAATPIGEGVYAITTTGRNSHLAYLLTLPEHPGDVQQEMGIASRGSFVLSAKNPTAEGPANTQLPKGPDFPKELMDAFRGLRWAPLQPEHLDYANSQLLLIGEASGELGAAVEPTDKDAKNDKETPLEEMEKLEGEDEQRAEALDDAVFEDLGLSHKEYPKLKTTW